MRRLITLFLIIGGIGANAQLQNQKDDPQARLEFEFMRTKNPITNSIPVGIRIKEKLLMDQRQKELQSQVGRVAAPPSTTWENRGPYNVGGRTRALAVDVSDATENTILAGGVSGGVWRTADGGATWAKMTTSTDLQSITCIAQDTRTGEEDTWYYGTGETSGNSASAAAFSAFYRGDGIFKSTDGGLTWNALASTLSETPESNDNSFDYNHEIIVNPTNGDVLVANQNGIYLSDDAGTSWEQVLSGSGWSDVAVTSAGILYAFLSGDGIYQSTTGGGSGTWANISDINTPFNSGDRYEIAIAPSDEDIVYFLGEDNTDSNNPDHALWKFEDDLDDWTDLTANIPRLGGLTGDFDSQGGYDLLIKVKNDDPDFVVIGGTNLFASSDGFSTPNTAASGNANWIGGYTSSNSSYALYPDHHPDQHSFIFLDGNRAYSGNDGGVQLTTDVTASSVTWTPLNNGYLTSQIYAVSAGPEDQLLIGLQDNGTWYANNSTTTTDAWDDAWGGDGAYSAISSDGTVRFLSAQNANVTIWTYADANTQAASTAQGFVPSESDGYSTSLFITPFYLDPEDDNLFYLGGDSELWVNTEAISSANIGGANQGWKSIATGVSGIISEIGIGTGEVVYVGTSSGSLLRVTNASAATPTVENVTGSNFPSGYISGVSVNSSNNNNVLVTFSNYGIPSVFYTNDGGENWTDVSGNLEEDPSGSGSGPSVRVGRIHGNDFSYFVGTSTGLYSTENLDGASTIWTREDESGIGSTVVEHMVTREDGLVVAATHGNGVYSAVVPFFDTDIAVNSIDEPETGVFTDNETSILATLTNSGNLVVTDFTIELYIDDQLVVSDDVTTTLNSFGTYQHTFSETFDFTTVGEYEIRVEVDLTGDEDETSNELITTIISLAEPTNITLSNNIIAEKELSGTKVGDLEAEDEDDEDHTFSLVSGDGSDDNDSFSITGSELISGEIFDFDEQTVYTIRIETADDDGNTFAKSFEVNISDVLAVDEWEEAGITVYPNPTKDRVSLEMKNDFIGEVSIKLVSLDGKQILIEKSYSKKQKATRSLLDVSNLDAGVYYVTFNFGGKEITSKLIKE
ncbi:T9SS type A sorting domain-containing protein [Ekhidna sp. To15]|uniref:T9SS type A sorting domain-containing protein n=1 Tax=Ekhidna sp. To15 TaxID=3395267 RepID=UPI003F51B224